MSNAHLLLPLIVAPGWLAADHWRGQLTWFTWAAVSFVAFIGFVGLVMVFTPNHLTADHDGVRWRQFLWRKHVRWSEIEEIGVARYKALNGYNHPAYGQTFRRMRRAEMIGVNLRVRDDPGTVAYRRGFTGYDFSIPNVFDLPTQAIVAELQRHRAQFQSCGAEV